MTASTAATEAVARIVVAAHDHQHGAQLPGQPTHRVDRVVRRVALAATARRKHGAPARLGVVDEVEALERLELVRPAQRGDRRVADDADPRRRAGAVVVDRRRRVGSADGDRRATRRRRRVRRQGCRVRRRRFVHGRASPGSVWRRVDLRRSATVANVIVREVVAGRSAPGRSRVWQLRRSDCVPSGRMPVRRTPLASCSLPLAIVGARPVGAAVG